MKELHYQAVWLSVRCHILMRRGLLDSSSSTFIGRRMAAQLLAAGQSSGFQPPTRDVSREILDVTKTLMGIDDSTDTILDMIDEQFNEPPERLIATLRRKHDDKVLSGPVELDLELLDETDDEIVYAIPRVVLPWTGDASEVYLELFNPGCFPVSSLHFPPHIIPIKIVNSQEQRP